MLKPVVLASDLLLWLMFVSFAYIYYTQRQDSVKAAAWVRLYNRPIKTIALMLVSLYALITLLDSIHFGYTTSSDVFSLLDYIMGGLATNYEASYSAPFATHAYNEQLVKLATGELAMTNPELIHINPKPILPLITQAVFVAAVIALLITIFAKFMHSYAGWRLPADIPRRTFYISCLLLLLLICMAYQLASHYHILGTNKIGVDVFYASLKSIRTGFVIGSLTTVISMPFAIILGCVAGYFRGFVDDLVQYLYTVLSSVPGVLLISSAILMFDVLLSRHLVGQVSFNAQSDLRLLLLCSILGLSSWTSLCRLLRAETLKLQETEFVLAARTLGISAWRIIIKHIVPNLWHLILITMALDFSGLVLAEAVLSYVGVGVSPDTYSWGTMINAARLEMARIPAIWWSLTGAFVLMFVLVLSANIVADAVAEVMEPKADA